MAEQHRRRPARDPVDRQRARVGRGQAHHRGADGEGAPRQRGREERAEGVGEASAEQEQGVALPDFDEAELEGAQVLAPGSDEQEEGSAGRTDAS